MQWWFKQQLKKLDGKGPTYRIVLLLCAGLPIVVLVALVLHYSVNVPFWDQWDLVTLLQRHNHGATDLSGLFAQHNEHRLLFPQFVMIVLATATHWNVIVEMMFSILVAGFGLWFVYSMLASTLKTPGIRLLAVLLVTIILFSPLQQENWLWGWQMQWFMNVFGLVVAVWALTTWHQSPLLRVLVAIAAGVFATYSLASGIFIWLVCVPVFMLRKDVRGYWWVWAVAAVGADGAYYFKYQNPGYFQPSTPFLLHHIPLFLHYTIVYIAHPLAAWMYLSVPAFVLLAVSLIGAFTYLWQYQRILLRTTLLPWLILGLYALLAALATDYSRLGLGISQSYSSRYTTISQYLTIACCVLLFALIDRSWHEKMAKRHKHIIRWAAGASLVLMSIGVLIAYHGSIELMRQSYTIRREGYVCARTATSVQWACLSKLYPSNQIVWPRLEYLRHIHWAGLS